MQGVSCVLSLSVLALATGNAVPSCKSDSGTNVDFAYSFKYPGGFEYAYMDSQHKLSKSSHTLDSGSSSVSTTLMQMHNSGVSYLMWNGQMPDHDASKPRAHSKGALIFSSSGGLWLTHSLPQFPAKGASSASGLWADAADDFGQAFLCISLTAEDIHKLSPVFNVTRPVVIESSFASGMEKTFADVKSWADSPYGDSMTTEATVKSKGGQTFQFFGKSGNWGTGKDLYRDLVAPKVGELEMEGWRRGAGVWGPACGSHKVLDVMGVKFPGQDWDTMNDHSKWAVAKTSTTFCVGDLNRADGQAERGGGTVCIKDSSFASQMRAVIQSTDKCSGDIVMV